MRFRSTAVLLACLVFTTTPSPAFAQAAAPASQREVTLFEMVLRDGSRLYGSIEGHDDAEVLFKTQAGALVTVKRAEIVSLRKMTGSVVSGEFLPPDPNATRLFFGPTGRSLAKGQTYLGVYEFIMPFVQVGVTDRFSIGGGTPLVFGLEDGDRPFWITPKLQVVDSAGTQMAVGVFHGFNLSGDGGGVGYVVETHGDPMGSLTGGAGVAYGSDGGRSWVVMAGGERRVRRNLKLITENYVWRSGSGIVSGGVRFFGERLSADLALAVPLGSGELFAFPIVNFVYVF